MFFYIFLKIIFNVLYVCKSSAYHIWCAMALQILDNAAQSNKQTPFSLSL